MNTVDYEPMRYQCNKCGAIHTTFSLKVFHESNKYPPCAYFMCKDCKQMAELNSSEMPRRLFAHLVSKIIKERYGEIDQLAFDGLPEI